MVHPLRIVAADDEPAMVDYYRDALARCGHQVLVADNGRRLVELARAVRPDVIVTDFDMPEMNGLEAVQEISKERPIPIILVTGVSHADLPECAWDCVATVLKKPVRLTDLEQAIERAARLALGSRPEAEDGK